MMTGFAAACLFTVYVPMKDMICGRESPVFVRPTQTTDTMNQTSCGRGKPSVDTITRQIRFLCFANRQE